MRLIVSAIKKSLKLMVKMYSRAVLRCSRLARASGLRFPRCAMLIPARFFSEGRDEFKLHSVYFYNRVTSIYIVYHL